MHLVGSKYSATIEKGDRVSALEKAKKGGRAEKDLRTHWL